MRVRQRIIAALLILAMGTMNAGTLSVDAAEMENQKVTKEAQTESEGEGAEKPTQKIDADEPTVEKPTVDESAENEPEVDEPTVDESTEDGTQAEEPAEDESTADEPEEKAIENAPEQQTAKQDDRKK